MIKISHTIKRMYERRVVFSIGVTFQTPYEKLAAIPATIRSIIEAQSEVRFDRAHFKGYSSSSLGYEVVYYVKNSDCNTYMDIQQAINLGIYRRFQDDGIDFAYPTQTVYLENGAGDRATATLGNAESRSMTAFAVWVTASRGVRHQNPSLRSLAKGGSVVAGDFLFDIFRSKRYLIIEG
jgi:hypothetical protein